MISTVTTTTVTAVATRVLGSSFPLIAGLSLLLLLGLKVVLTASDRPVARRVGQVLDVAIVPLLLCFAIVVALKLFQGLH